MKDDLKNKQRKIDTMSFRFWLCSVKRIHFERCLQTKCKSKINVLPMNKILWPLNWNMNVVYVDNPQHIGEKGWKMKASPKNESEMEKQTEKSLFYGFQRTKIKTDKLTDRTHLFEWSSHQNVETLLAFPSSLHVQEMLLISIFLNFRW